MLLKALFPRFANRAARFISAYDQDLSGSEAAWINNDYHGHRTVPPVQVALAKAACVDMNIL
ncbi:hypothetical protein B0H13DRAFT_1673848 [Mycena leptocephala]|nr:hypothetical protein B0H13DRAFT_1673848 [Mycena leptocephala]